MKNRKKLEDIEKRAFEYQRAKIEEQKVSDKLQSVRRIVGKMNCFEDIPMTTEKRLEYDCLRNRLSKTMSDLKTRDEDVWAVANRYVQDNLNVLSVW